MSETDTLAEAAERILQARSLVQTLDDEFLLYLIDMSLMQLGKRIAQKLSRTSLDDQAPEVH